MRILVMTRFYLNGQTTHVLSLCSRLRESGCDPYLAMAGFNHPAYYQWLKTRGIQFAANTSFGFLDGVLRRGRFSLIHTHSSHTLDAALELGRKHRLPVVATCHYLDFQPLEKLWKADRIIAISEEMRDSLALPAEKTVVIENGVDLAQFKPGRTRDPDQRQALIATRMTDQKEPGFVRLVQVLAARGWQVKSVGNWRPYSLGIAYTGWKIDLSEDYQAADLVIGTGRGIREGMAAGAAALVLGDYLDGVVGEKNVELLRRCNFSGRALKKVPDEENIASEIDQLSPTRLKELQEFSLYYSRRHFSDRNMAQAVIKVYQSCLA